MSRREDVTGALRLLFALSALGACTDRGNEPPADNGGAGGTLTEQGTGGVAGSTPLDAASDSPTPTQDAGRDQAASSLCETPSLCEGFEGYGATGAITDKQALGPWRAALANGATMELSAKHTFSGATALHIHIDNAVTAGGRLFAAQPPLLLSKPTRLYGRMMMYLETNGSSVHWTFFGANGPALPNSPAAGRTASYLLSSLPKNGVNTYAFVYGLSAKGSDGYHDCWAQSSTAMPGAWSCVAFDFDSDGKSLRMYQGSDANRILSVQDRGDGCVAPTNGASPWYGPAANELYVGAWSFHPMKGRLDVWIDDLVLSTKPVPCAGL